VRCYAACVAGEAKYITFDPKNWNEIPLLPAPGCVAPSP
jgi:hypothetical protein